MHNTLVIYFSKSGRTKKIAEQIAQELAASTHEILTEKKYPSNYLMTILESRKEFKHNEKPVLIDAKIEDFASYDRIILGFPVWFFTCPMAIVSFLEKYDFSGKEIFPFCTSGGSSCDKAAAKIRELCPTAKVHELTRSISQKFLSGSRIKLTKYFSRIIEGAKWAEYFSHVRIIITRPKLTKL